MCLRSTQGPLVILRRQRNETQDCLEVALFAAPFDRLLPCKSQLPQVRNSPEIEAVPSHFAHTLPLPTQTNRG
jgi:hypothetical protein